MIGKVKYVEAPPRISRLGVLEFRVRRIGHLHSVARILREFAAD